MTDLPKSPTRITPAFGKQYIKRSLQECLTDRKFGQEDKEATVKFFERWEPQPACVFCGSRKVTRWDHLIAVSKFGLTALGNLVPACGTCDDSKGNRPFAEWMRGSAAKSPMSLGVPNVDQRVEHIESFIAHYETRPLPFEERLTAAELLEVQAIDLALEAVYARANQLIQNYRVRTGAA